MIRYHILFFVCLQFLLVTSVGADEKRLLMLDSALLDIRNDNTLPHDLRAKKIDKIEIELNRLEEAEPNSPVLWYVKSSVSEARMIVRLDKLGKPYDESIEVYKKRYVETFSKAMELDETYEPHLTANMYHRKAWLLPLDLKLEAYRQELKFDPIGEYAQMRDTVYGRMLSTLYDAGRYEEAIELVNEMTADPKWLELWKTPEEHVLAMKEKITRFEQKIKERGLSEATTEVAKSAQPKAQTPTVKPTSVQTPKPTIPKVEPAPEKTDNSFWYLVLGVLILLVAVGALVRKRR